MQDTPLVTNLALLYRLNPKIVFLQKVQRWRKWDDEPKTILTWTRRDSRRKSVVKGRVRRSLVRTVVLREYSSAHIVRFVFFILNIDFVWLVHNWLEVWPASKQISRLIVVGIHYWMYGLLVLLLDLWSGCLLVLDLWSAGLLFIGFMACWFTF